MIYVYNSLCFIVDISHIDKLYKTNSIARHGSLRNECFPSLISFFSRNRTVHVYRRHPKSFHLLDLVVFVCDYVEKWSYLLACFWHCYRFPLLWVLIYQRELQNSHFKYIERIWMFASPSRCWASLRSFGSLVAYLTDGGPGEVGGVGTLPRSAHI